MVMAFTIIYFDIEHEHFLQILGNKHGKLVRGILGVLDMITKYYFSNIINKQTFLLGSF